ncbi:MAG: 50S ribosomal protein L19 [Patescibacteria group bacterium]
MSQITKTHTPVDIEKRKKLDIRAGDTVRVSVKIEEKGKTRTQEFEGIVLSQKHGNEPGATFTVRRTSGSIGVEKVFPLFSPVIEKIEVVKRAKSRQSNLYHIREKAAKEVRRHIKNVRVVRESDEDMEGESDENVLDTQEDSNVSESEEGGSKEAHDNKEEEVKNKDSAQEPDEETSSNEAKETPVS